MNYLILPPFQYNVFDWLVSLLGEREPPPSSDDWRGVRWNCAGNRTPSRRAIQGSHPTDRVPWRYTHENAQNDDPTSHRVLHDYRQV